MPLPSTSPLGLPQYESTDDFDFADVNNTYERINDLVVPTVCTAGTRPATDLFVGRTIWQTDTEQFFVWDGSKWLLAVNEFFKPMYRGYLNANSSKGSGVSSAASLTDEYAVEASFPISGASYVRIITVPGYYEVHAQATWAANGTGTRSIDIRKNITGTDVATGTVLARNSVAPTASIEACPEVTWKGPLSTGDTICFSTVQTSGAALDLVGAQFKTFLEIEWLRPN